MLPLFTEHLAFFRICGGAEQLSANSCMAGNERHSGERWRSAASRFQSAQVASAIACFRVPSTCTGRPCNFAGQTSLSAAKAGTL